MSNSEGFEFRVGGGYGYPLKIQDVYHNVSDWVPPNGGQKAARASISKAMGEFGLGSGTNKAGHGAWKEIYTDRCIETDKWIHMVATWDGTNMLVYLNGHNATDNWRSVGSELPVFIRDISNITVGDGSPSGGRHFDGKIGYVKVYNQALSPSEVWHKYKESLGSERCVDFIKIESPRCGEVITHDTKITCAIKDSLDNDVTPPGQTFNVAICREPTFSDSVYRIQTTSNGCTFGDLVGADSGECDGVFFVHISAHNNTGLSKTATNTIVAESGTLLTYLLASPAKVVPHAISKGITSIRQLTSEVVYDIRGREVGVGAKSALSSLKHGIYFIKMVNGTGQKILYMK
jgi:hypothetical protein